MGAVWHSGGGAPAKKHTGRPLPAVRLLLQALACRSSAKPTRDPVHLLATGCGDLSHMKPFTASLFSVHPPPPDTSRLASVCLLLSLRWSLS